MAERFAQQTKKDDITHAGIRMGGGGAATSHIFSSLEKSMMHLYVFSSSVVLLRLNTFGSLSNCIGLDSGGILAW